MLLIDEPKLECNHCYKLWGEAGCIPLCKTERGCPIKDLATSPEVNRGCSLYMHARAILEKTSLSKPLESFYRQLEIEEEIDLQFEFERIWSEYKDKLQQEKQGKNGRK